MPETALSATPPYDPGRPDGENASLQSAISADGRPEPGRRYEVPARCGVAVRLRAGERLTLINPQGTQVCDLWAFAADAPGGAMTPEHLSMPNTHTAIAGVFPKPGDPLVTNTRRKIFDFEADSSPGVHDTVMSCCDLHRYRMLGVEGYHDNCTDNLRMALIAIGERAPVIPAPFNVWMNIPIAPDGAIDWRPTVSKPGDACVFRAAFDCVAVMSACPQDITPINGEGVAPCELAFEVA